MGFIWYFTFVVCTFGNWPVIKTYTFVLAIFLGWIWVHLLIDHWINQTLCVSYYTKLFWGTVSIGHLFWINFAINQRINQTLWVHSAIDNWSKQTLCVSFFIQFIWFSIFIIPWILVHLLLDQWLKHILCVSVLTWLNVGSFDDWPVIEAATIC